MSYKENREWSDEYMPSVKSILGKAIINESTFEQDTEQAFDLLTPNQKKIACRVRDYDKYKQYIDEFTIRSQSKYGKRTEIHKILDGFGDWMFYGFTKGDDVIFWSIIDLDVFRSNHHSAYYQENFNYDGTAFRAYKIGSFSPNIVIQGNIEIQFGFKKIHPNLLPIPEKI